MLNLPLPRPLLIAAFLILLFNIGFAKANSVTYVCKEFYDAYSKNMISTYPSTLEKKQKDGRSIITWRGRGLNPIRPNEMWSYQGFKVGELGRKGFRDQTNDLYVMLHGPPPIRPIAPREFDWQLSHGIPVIVQEFQHNLVLFFVSPDIIGETPRIQRTTCFVNERHSSE